MCLEDDVKSIAKRVLMWMYCVTAGFALRGLLSLAIVQRCYNRLKLRNI